MLFYIPLHSTLLSLRLLSFASQSDDRRNDITGEDDRLTRSFHQEATMHTVCVLSWLQWSIDQGKIHIYIYIAFQSVD